MFRYSGFLLLFVLLSNAEFNNNSVLINIRNNQYCIVEIKLIEEPLFNCQQNDYSGIQYNETHSSYIKRDKQVKCYATIRAIEMLARFCLTTYGVGYNSTVVPEMLGRDRVFGKPLDKVVGSESIPKKLSTRA